jgi:choline dehydrogenase-like flavoprotein
VSVRRRHDLALVGFGLAGSSFLERWLRRTPHSDVCVVEQRRRWSPRDSEPVPGFPLLHATPSSEDDPVLLAYRGAQRVLNPWWRAQRAGGGSILWYGNLRRFDACDIAPTSASDFGELGDHEAHDWGITLGELEPYYDEVLRLLLPYQLVLGGVRPAELVRSRVRASKLETVLLERLRRAPDLHAEPSLTCLGGRSWDRAPFDPLTLKHRSDVGPLEVRPNPYASAVAALEANGAVTVYDGQRVAQLIHASGRALGLALVGDDGTVKEVYARTIVLACGTVESTRIVLASGVVGAPRVGHGFTFSSELTRYLVTDIPVSSDLIDRALESVVSVSVEDVSEPGRLCRGKLTIYNAAAFEAPEKALASADLGTEERIRILNVASQCYVLKLSFKGQSVPWRGKRLSLSSLRSGPGLHAPLIDYEPHPFDQRVLEYGLRMVQRVADAMPGRLLPAREPNDPSSAHQHGGLACTRDPSQTVTSATGELLACRGVHVIDGSFMPTSGHTNSSWTILANALRVADRLSVDLPGAAL